MKRKVLFITCELPPLPGCPVTGGGLRVYGLKEGLQVYGHEVILSVPKEKLAKVGKVGDQLAPFAHVPEQIGRVIAELRPDVILFEQWGTASHLPTVDIPTVFDLHGALSLENAYRSGGDFTADALTKIETLAKADLLTCPGVYQRNYFLSWWVMAGADPRTARIEVVPVCLSPQTPKRRKQKGIRFVYSGTAWPWIDPFPGLGVLAEKVARNDQASLDLYLGRPKAVLEGSRQQEEGAQYDLTVKQLTGLDRVVIHDPIARDDLLKEYLSCAFAFDVYRRNPERELAFTTRTVEYLWSGVPAIYGNYGELAPLIESYGAGLIVDPEDGDSVAAAVDKVLANPEMIEEMSRAARKLARERFAWDVAVAPLAAYIAQPTRRKDKKSILSGYKKVMDDYWERLHKEKITDLEKENRNQVDKLQQQVTAANEKLWKVSQEKDEIHRKELDKRDQQSARLEAKFTSMDRDYQQQIRQQASERLELSKAKDEDLRVQRKSSERELAQRDDEIHRLREERTREIAQRDESIISLQRKVDEIQQQAEQRLLNFQSERIEQMAAKDREIEKSWAERTREVEKRDRQIEKLQDQVAELVKERDKAKDEIAERNAEFEMVKNDNKRLSTELEDTRRWAKQLEEESGERLGALQTAVEEQERVITEAEDNFEQMEETISEQAEHISFLGDEVERISQEAGEHIQRLEEEREDQNKLLGKMDHLRREMEARDRALAYQLQTGSSKFRQKLRRKNRIVFRSFPKLAWLFFVNLVTNFYMEKWQKKHGKQIFPGHVKNKTGN